MIIVIAGVFNSDATMTNPKNTSKSHKRLHFYFFFVKKIDLEEMLYIQYLNDTQLNGLVVIKAMNNKDLDGNVLPLEHR
jgi:hypothetical protein